MKITIFGYTVEIYKKKEPLPDEVCFNCGKVTEQCNYWNDNKDGSENYVCPKCRPKLTQKENRQFFNDVSKRIEDNRPLGW